MSNSDFAQRIRLAAAPSNLDELFADLLPNYVERHYTEQEKLAIVWVFAMAGHQMSSVGVDCTQGFLNVLLSNAKRQKNEEQEEQ